MESLDFYKALAEHFLDFSLGLSLNYWAQAKRMSFFSRYSAKAVVFSHLFLQLKLEAIYKNILNLTVNH